MPGGNRKGPVGMGAMTGRSAGYCAGFGTPGYANPAPGGVWGLGLGRVRGGRGRGFGRGGGGRRNRFHAAVPPGWVRFGGGDVPPQHLAPHDKPDPEAERRLLENRAAALRSELESIARRLGEIRTKTPPE
jgi:hypothetical protein